MNKILSDHRMFLARHDYSIPRDARLEHCTGAELGLLRKYGTWMAAMENGLLAPITSAQRHFLLVCEGREAPTTDIEIAWDKLKRGIRADGGHPLWMSHQSRGKPPRVWMVCPLCGGSGSAGSMCSNCGGTGWLDEQLSPRNRSEYASTRPNQGGIKEGRSP